MNFYSQWRQAPQLLREDTGFAPTERLLQAIWRHQRVRRDKLTTVDGRRVRVWHPGFWNRGAGPDFRDAVVQLDDDAPQTGDVEIDLTSADWHRHRHADNPEYARVILHVIWRATSGSAPAPALLLEPFCDAPLIELEQWSTSAVISELPIEFTGRCRAPLAELPESSITALLQQAAWVRLQQKAAHLAAVARHADWDHALWCGLARALGYQHNTWPMQSLAERLPILRDVARGDPLHWQALLLGVAGLLPSLDNTTGASRALLQSLWDIWWRERDRLREHQLPAGIWQLRGCRPANHPQRRVALLAQWCALDDLPRRLEQWFNTSLPLPQMPGTLEQCLRGDPDDYWCWHWTLSGPRQPAPCALLGKQRVGDLAVNVILPWLWARAADSPSRQQRVRECFLAWPATQQNSVTRLASQRLFAGRRPSVLRSAAGQQGILQIARDFCQHAPATCDACRFPDLVRDFAASPTAASDS